MVTTGVTSREISDASNQRLVLRFQTDVSFNGKSYQGAGASWTDTDISANDWVIEISGNRPTGWNGWNNAFNGQWVDISNAFGASNNTTQNANDGYEIKTMYDDGTSDVSYNAISMTLRTTLHNQEYAAWYGDDLRVSMKNMDNKSLGRQYIDISGNKLVAKKGVNYAAAGNVATFPITNNIPQLTFDISEGTFSWDPQPGGGEALSDVVARWDQDISQNWTGTLSSAFKSQFSVVWKDSGGNNITFANSEILTASVASGASGGTLSLNYMLISPSATPATAEFTYTRDGTNGLVNFRTNYANNASSFSLDSV